MSDDCLDLIRFHDDELCLEVIAEHEDPRRAWGEFEPIARGYRIRAWRCLLNLNFLGKAESLPDLDWDDSRSRPVHFLPDQHQRIAERMAVETGSSIDE
ncbi:MAG: hypothetical protein IPM94_08195 [bacterium]|nr:hypothetical protein [bacterium]